MEISLTDILHELQYKEFCSFVKEYKLDSEDAMLNELVIPGKLKKIWSFLVELKDIVKVKIMDLAKLFLNKVVFKFFAKIKFSMSYLFKLVKKGFKAYKEVIKAIGDYLSKTKVGRWTEDKLKDLDAFLAKHPKTKRMGSRPSSAGMRTTSGMTPFDANSRRMMSSVDVNALASMMSSLPVVIKSALSVMKFDNRE